MPNKKYLVYLKVENEFLPFKDNIEATNHLLDNVENITFDNVSVYEDEINWKEKAKKEAQNILDTPYVQERLKTGASVNVTPLIKNITKDMFNYEIDKPVDCLRELSEWDNDTEAVDTSNFAGFLQERARLAYERIVTEKLKKLIEYNS